MANFNLKLKAHQLRRRGKSIRTISSLLDIPKSTASIWCRDIALSNKQKTILRDKMIKGGHKGRILGAEANRKKKLARIEFHRKQARKDIARLSTKEWLIAGIALYWGEGSKTSQLAFSNSDPKLIRFMKRWFEKNMNVKKDEFMPRVFINEIHRPRINKVLEFWASYLSLPLLQFGKPVFIKVKQKKVYENHDSYYGVLSLRVRKSTDMKYRILGLIEALGDKS